MLGIGALFHKGKLRQEKHKITYPYLIMSSLNEKCFFVIQEEITAVTKEGKLLLSSFEEPDCGKCSQDQQQERPGDWETVNR